MREREREEKNAVTRYEIERASERELDARREGGAYVISESV